MLTAQLLNILTYSLYTNVAITIILTMYFTLRTLTRSMKQ